jgi:hypothetical protein
MPNEAASAGFHEHKMNQQKHPRLQLRPVKELMEGKGILRPSTVAAKEETFKKAPKARARGHSRSTLEFQEAPARPVSRGTGVARPPNP